MSVPNSTPVFMLGTNRRSDYPARHPDTFVPELLNPFSHFIQRIHITSYSKNVHAFIQDLGRSMNRRGSIDPALTLQRHVPFWHSSHAISFFMLVCMWLRPYILVQDCLVHTYMYRDGLDFWAQYRHGSESNRENRSSCEKRSSMIRRTTMDVMHKTIGL